MNEAREIAKQAIAKAEHARCFPTRTDAASRHALMIAKGLVGRGYPMLNEEPEHCACSIASTVAGLWEARARIAELERALKLNGRVARKTVAALLQSQGSNFR